MKRLFASVRWWDWLIAVGLVALVAVLRIRGISDNSITQDESTMVLFAQGVLERGYPFLRQVHSEFLISTYEIVPYPIAASMAVFGQNELGIRMPSVFFAMGTCLLILRFGTQLFDRRVGVLAALLFAVLPWSIYWGSNAFYPSQVQFFSLITTMIIHRLITEDKPKIRVYYALLVAFTFSYLSWEGSGFLLPIFFVMILGFRWGRWQWLLNPHGWIAASLIILVIVGQLTYRTVLREPYLGIMVGRSEISFATIAFTSVGYDPFFYYNGLKSEAHVVLAWALVMGLFMLPGSRWLRFLYLFLGLIVAFLTSALGYYALRYIYLALPLALLAASAATVMLVDRLIPKRDAASPGKWLRHVGLAVAFALHLSVASPWGFYPLEAAEGLTGVRPYELRQELPGFAFQSIAEALKERRRPGDAVVVQAPFPFKVYSGDSGDYFLQSVTASSVFYDPKSMPYYTDKWVANPIIRDRSDLDQVLTKHNRVWLVSTPDGASRLSTGDDLYAVFEKQGKLVLETEDGRLFLWEKPGTVATSGVSQ